MSRHNRQKGLSLVELLIAMLLGLVLLLGVSEIFVRSSQTYRVQDGLSEMQENARFALNFLLRDVRSAGYLGCGNLSRITPTVSAGLLNYTAATVIQGYQNTGASVWSPVLPATMAAGGGNTVVPAANSDVVTIMNAGACKADVLANMANADSNINVAASNDCGFANNDVVMISDCTSADVLRVTSAPTAGLFSHTTLSRPYTSDAEVMTLTSLTYFVALDPNNAIPTLYILDNSLPRSANNPIALFQGVENLQILYGEDSDLDGVPNIFRDADDVTDWTAVISAQITVLMRSAGNANAGPYVHNVGGTSITYNDGVLRKPFAATVQLRNRG